MTSKINQTLLKELFLNPSPYDRKNKIYEMVKHKLYPCEDVFIDFLSKSDASEQRARAKYIVQRLCFEANFPPPFTLLENLADFETDTENRSQNITYIPQDHFTHIVYMYLLGIYAFFYHRSINIALTNEFKRKRESNSFHLAKEATEDFIEYWKYFCLFHDLAYPIEQLCKPKSKDTTKTCYLECFNNLFNCLSRELLAECAARFLVLWQIINDDENNELFSTVCGSLENLTWSKIEHASDAPVCVDNSSISTRFGKYKSVAKIHCYDHLKMLSGFVSTKDYIAVLFDAITEQPIAIKSVMSTNICYYFLNGDYSEIGQTKAREYLDSEDAILAYNYYIRYYFEFDKASCGLLYLKNGSGSVFSEDDYKKIADMLSSQFKTQPEMKVTFNGITTGSELDSYIFQTYQTILGYINNRFKPTEEFPKQTTTEKIKNNSEIIKNFIKNSFLSYFKTAVISQLPFSDFNAAKESLESLKPESGTQEIKNVIGQAVDDLFKDEAVFDYKNKIKDEFSKTLIDDIENEKTCHGAFIQFISQCNKILLSNISVEQTNIFEPCRVDIQKLFDMINNSLTNEPRLEGLEEYIKKKMSSFDPKEEISLLEFVKRYKTEYITYDHGIYGALIFLCSVQYYYMLINKLFVSDRQDPIADIMSTLCWNVERNSFERRLKRDNAFIIQTVLRSIFCHNLYPDDLRNVFNSTNEWRYDFMKEPSNYFAMMIDSLQTWNRSKYYKFSDVNWWPTFSSDEYDISIKNNSIILKVIGYESDLEFLNYKFIKEKEKYLKEFSSYVTLDFKNTK